MLQYQTISCELKSLLHELMKVKKLAEFILVGGTALSLRYGHRVSIDIDLFAAHSFDVDSLDRCVEDIFPESVLLLKERHGISRIINQIKVDFYYFGTQFIRKHDTIDTIRICSVEDIAAFKFESLVRLERKDFYDIAVILNHFTLREMVSFYKEKYPNHDIRLVFDNLLRIKESENTPDPVIINPDLTWEYTTNKILNAFSGYKSILLDEKRKKETDRIKKAEALLKDKRKSG